MQTNSVIKKEVSRWNWGAFLLTWIWGIGNGVYISLLALIPGINFIIAIVLGIRGGEMAWKNNKCLSLDEFIQNQKAWAKWGLIFLILVFFASLLVVRQAVLNIEKEDKAKYRDSQRIVYVHEIVSAINHYKLENNQECPERVEYLVPDFLKQLPQEYSQYIYHRDKANCLVSVELEMSDNLFLKNDANPENGAVYDLEAEDISSLINY